MIIIQREQKSIYLSHAAEMAKNQILPVYKHLPIVTGHLIVHPVPERQICPLMLRYDNTAEKRRPFIQVFLVTEFSVFRFVVTPFETSFSPPLEAVNGIYVIAERDEADVKVSMEL